MLLFYWQWFLFSLLVCLGIAFGYLRYSTSIYQEQPKLLIKDSDSNRRSSKNAMTAENLGLISMTNGFDNELEILRSSFIGEDVIRRLNLNVIYYQRHRIKSMLMYKNQPLNVSMASANMEQLKRPVELRIEKDNDGYDVDVEYYAPINNNDDTEYVTLEKNDAHHHFAKLPAYVKTKVGVLKIEYHGT